MKENKIDNVKRFLFMLLGNYCIGLASAIFRTADFGTDPFTCMNLGISSHLPISYGTYQMLVNLVLFVPVIILARESFGAGCLVNMLGIGYISDFMVFVFGKLGLSIESIHAYIPLRIVLVFVALLILGFGCGVYMECHMGASPYDMIPQIIEDKSKGRFRFKWARVMDDMICLTIGFLTGARVQFATIIVAFGTGPLFAFFREKVAKRIVPMKREQQPPR